MNKQLKHAGKYELLETGDGKTVLSLDRSNYYIILKSSYGDTLVKDDTRINRKKTLKKGTYYMIDFSHDPDFGNILHLFLENGKEQFDEWILPDDLPTSTNKRVILSMPIHKTNLKSLLKHIYDVNSSYLQQA